MAEILLFHHAHGLTDGLCDMADRLRSAGHTVHAPDSYSGRTFDNLDDGIAFAESIGHDALAHVAMRSTRMHRGANVALGFSMGTMQAQLIAQHARRIQGCVLMGGAMDPAQLGSAWRSQVPLQVHVADPDDWCTAEEVSALHRCVPGADVFTYTGEQHMFVDPSLPDYDGDAADLFEERVLAWLTSVDAGTARPAPVAM
ncbi:dienelactone hydrolase family protein [Demequina sediminicola]|uniref:dienelactone hydrolase family protein n=1 Tax=Demequina sediminicola TaxID=1095026 RepID=UPI000781ED5A|nr:dienelactone hydrolase family protein [Demequina sediminicola]